MFDVSELKTFPSNKLNIAEMTNFVCDSIENNLGQENSR